MSDKLTEVAMRKTIEQSRKPPPPQSQGDGLTTAQELLARRKTRIVQLGSGFTCEIRSINVGDFFGSVGTLLAKRMVADGIKLNDDAAITEYVTEQMTIDQHMEINNTEEAVRARQDIVIAGVRSINFTIEDGDRCPDGFVPIDLMSRAEIIELSDIIIELSVPRQDEAMFRSGRETSEKKQDAKDGVGQSGDNGRKISQVTE